MGSPRLRLMTAACAVLALGVSACGSSSSSDTSGSTGSSAASTTSSTTSATASTVSAASLAIAEQYTGGKAGTKADASLKPFVIGFANQSGATPAYPEYIGAADAAVKLINDHLGGVGGHPVKLDKCIIQTEEDGQKCAAQMLADGVSIANFSLASNGNASFYKTVGGKFPIVVSVAASGADYTTPDVYELDGGGDGVLNALSQNAKQQGAKSVAIVSSDNPAGKFATGNVLIPQLKKLGIKSKAIYISDTATTPDFVSALQAGGAASADLVVLIPPGAPQCVSTFDALKQLSIKKNVVTTYSCYGDPMPEHTNGGPVGWNMYGFGTNQRIDNPNTILFKTAMAEADQSKWTYVGSTFKTFGDIMTITKWANAVGYDKVTPAAMKAQLLAWTGPSFMVPGAVHCGHHPVYVGVCGDSAEGSTYKDGKWVSLGAVKNVTLKP